MTDIVERLRSGAKPLQYSGNEEEELAQAAFEAADKIERLRAKQAQMEAYIHMAHERDSAEIERLRAVPWTSQCKDGHIFLSGPKCPWCEVAMLRAERDALLAAAQCVIVNLNKGMSQSMQKLQAREFASAIDAARREA